MTGTKGREIRVANTKSAMKRNKQNEKRRLHNHAYKSAMRTTVRRAERAIESNAGNADTLESLREAISKIDKTAQKGIIHRNAAARKKSRLMARFNKAAAASA